MFEIPNNPILPTEASLREDLSAFLTDRRDWEDLVRFRRDLRESLFKLSRGRLLLGDSERSNAGFGEAEGIVTGATSVDDMK